jgi:hypothetical protein
MSKFIKHLGRLGALWALFLMSQLTASADDLSGYQLISVSSERFHYNFEYVGTNLYIGSDAGVLAYKDPLHIKVDNSTKKGYIFLENGQLKSSIYLNGNLFTPHYKPLLPDGFRHNSIIGTTFKNNLLIISKGQLFIYKKTVKPKADTLSIRTLSKNFIGSYGGLFSNGKRFTYPEYTNGYIREYPGETFICYDGLMRIMGTDTLRYEANNGNTQVASVDLGKVKDVFKIDTSRYLLFSDKGLCISDLKTKLRWIQKKTSGPEPRFIKAYYRDNLPVVIYYIDNNRIQKFNLLNDAYTTLLQIDAKLGNIEDVYINSTANIYFLTENKLIKAMSNLQENKYSYQYLAENLLGNHHIIPLNNLLLITSNEGLSSYNIDTREWIPHLIRDEFNHRAVYITPSFFFLGTIHGYYQLTKAQIEQLVIQRQEEIKLEAIPSYENHSQEIIYGLTALIVLLLGLSIYLIIRKKSPVSDSKAKAAEIIAYIDANLKDVTIVNICYEFKINPLQLNDILGNDKPGELIRSKRLDLVRKMRRERRREEDIAQVTGFSVSYLKKIKA